MFEFNDSYCQQVSRETTEINRHQKKRLIDVQLRKKTACTSPNCPCCSGDMLRHIRANQVYFFCRHCWQEMPCIGE